MKTPSVAFAAALLDIPVPEWPDALYHTAHQRLMQQHVRKQFMYLLRHRTPIEAKAFLIGKVLEKMPSVDSLLN